MKGESWIDAWGGGDWSGSKQMVTGEEGRPGPRHPCPELCSPAKVGWRKESGVCVGGSGEWLQKVPAQ